MNSSGSSRRSFLFSSGGVLTSAWLAAHWSEVAAAAHHAQHRAAVQPTGFQFLNPEEAADVDAICGQIVPGGATPGAREAHAIYFIDRALGSFFAGWANEFRPGLAEFQNTFRKANPAVARFASASPDVQLAFLQTVEETPFFESVRVLTLLGMFCSPQYGGNFQGLGWKLLGFEDEHVFNPPFGYYDKGYAGFVPYAGGKQS